MMFSGCCFCWNFRSNGNAHGSPGSMGNGKGSGLSPKSSSLGQQQQPPHSQHPPKHASFPSTSRLRPQGAQQPHYGSLQSSPETSPSTGGAPGQMMGDFGSNLSNGHLPSPQRGRLTGGGHPAPSMGHPVGPVSNMWPTAQWVHVAAADANAFPWSQGYAQPFIPAQNLQHEGSPMSKSSCS